MDVGSVRDVSGRLSFGSERPSDGLEAGDSGLQEENESRCFRASPRYGNSPVVAKSSVGFRLVKVK